ncbi:MAG: hypothetical protein HYY06_24925 [Deltaproteobacteria bacterium]|nr:hypothetical protein [Deltaproteobacteria bacterium]
MADEKPIAPGGSLADDEKALHKGRGKMMMFMVVVVIAAIAGAVFFVMQSGKGEEARVTQRSLNKLHADYYRPFWGCALQGPVERYKRDTDLIAKLSKMATGSEKRYAAYIRTKCMPQIAPYRTKLDSLPPAPEMYGDQIQELGARIDQVRSSWTDFVAYLESGDVDPETTPERVELVAKGWYEYAKTRREIQGTTLEALGEESTSAAR